MCSLSCSCSAVVQCGGSGCCSCNCSCACSCLSIYLSICKLENKAILRDLLNFRSIERVKAQQFCEISSKQFCETSFNNGNLSAELTASYQCVLRFCSPCLWSIALATKKWCQVIRSAAPVTQNHLTKTEDLMLQNATCLRKSMPWPPNSPNISDEPVSAPAMENSPFVQKWSETLSF